MVEEDILWQVKYFSKHMLGAKTIHATNCAGLVDKISQDYDEAPLLSTEACLFGSIPNWSRLVF